MMIDHDFDGFGLPDEGFHASQSFRLIRVENEDCIRLQEKITMVFGNEMNNFFSGIEPAIIFGSCAMIDDSGSFTELTQCEGKC